MLQLRNCLEQTSTCGGVDEHFELSKQRSDEYLFTLTVWQKKKVTLLFRYTIFILVFSYSIVKKNVIATIILLLDNVMVTHSLYTVHSRQKSDDLR